MSKGTTNREANLSYINQQINHNPFEKDYETNIKLQQIQKAIKLGKFDVPFEMPKKKLKGLNVQLPSILKATAKTHGTQRQSFPARPTGPEYS